MKRVLIFANPIAGSGAGRDIALRLEKGLARAGYAVQVWLAPPQTINAAATEVSAAIVVGGDGTIRAVADQLYTLATAMSDHPGGRHTDAPPLLIVPLGTANLLGRHLGINWSGGQLVEQVLSALQHGDVVHIDAARANGRMFLLMAGVGFDAAVVHELSRVRRGPISYFSYLEPAVRIAGSYAFPSIRVKVDGTWIFGPEKGVAFVGNIREYGTGFPFLPHARPNDGLLDVCCMPCSNVLEGARLFLLAAAGEHLQEEGVVYLKGKQVHIEAVPDGPVPVQIDGDAAGYLPLDLDLLPARLRLIVPP